MSKQDHDQKVILFLPLNAAGHLNSSVAIADRLRADHGYKSIFILVGPPPTNLIVNHGHELIQLDELNPLEDYEVEEDEDTSKPVDVELKQRQGKTMKIFDGSKRWPQIVARHQHKFKSTPFESFKLSPYLIGKYLITTLIANNTLIEQQITRINPDLIVCDAYLPAPLVLNEEHTRPWVRLQTANPLCLTVPKASFGIPLKPTSRLYTKRERERIRREEPARWQAMLDEWKQMATEIEQAFAQSYKSMRDFYKANGCDRLDLGKPAVNSSHINIYMFPEVLDYDQDDDLVEYPPRWLRCDSLIRKPTGQLETAEIKYWSQLLAARLKNMPSTTKLIYFSLGSIASGNLTLMKKYMDILSDDQHDDRLYIISKGINGHRYKLNERNMIGGDYIPQPFFLERADLAIVHGGNNSITECLYHGVPQIVLPNFSDQFDNAQRIDDFELGKSLNLINCSKDELLAAISSLLNDRSIKSRLESISARMQQKDELGKVSEVLRGLVLERRLNEDLARKYNVRLD